MIHDARARLTQQELEILRLVAERRSNGDVARILGVAEQTVKFHLTSTYRKLQVPNRWAAIESARRRGLIDPFEPDGDPGTGVREPRRPIKPTLRDGVALDPPAGATDD